MQVRSLPSFRTADPYRDLDVIDARAPRFNQAAVGLVSLLAILTGWWPLVALLSVQLVVGLRFGRRYCLPCLFYFEVVQPRIGEGEIEDARPPRFANILGAAFTGAASAAQLLGLGSLGWVLTGIVAALALLAAATGLCVGCEVYRLGARLRGVRPGRVSRIDPHDLGLESSQAAIVHFTHPLCTGCRELEQRLIAAGHHLYGVDVSARPDLARKYHVAVLPAAFEVDAGGRVVARLA